MTKRSWLPGGASRARSGREVRLLAEMAFTVLDIDVTGTDLHRDRVTGIVALPVRGKAFRIADLVYCPLAGGPNDQGYPQDEAARGYMALRDLVGAGPIVTFNPRFVRQMIAHACAGLDLPALDGEWIDLASAASVAGSEDNALTTMDHWREKMTAQGRWPHDATYDVFAMSQLLLVVLAYSDNVGIDSMEALAGAQKARAWLHGL